MIEIPPPAAATQIDHAAAAAAVRQVVHSMTSHSGADCMLYALVGAALLRALGVPAHAVAGSAAWRVGPGDGDVINHAVEAGGEVYEPDAAGVALPFHAWIEAPGLLVDFSTETIERKARQLDAADGGHTDVQWRPAFLWLEGDQTAGRLNTARDVTMADTAPAFFYRRHPNIEGIVFAARADLHVEQAVAQAAYAASRSGSEFHIIGVNSRTCELQEQPGEVPLKPHRPGGISTLSAELRSLG